MLFELQDTMLSQGGPHNAAV